MHATVSDEFVEALFLTHPLAMLQLMMAMGAHRGLKSFRAFRDSRRPNMGPRAHGS